MNNIARNILLAIVTRALKFGSRARSGRATSHADICTWRRLTRILHGRAKGSNRLRKATSNAQAMGLQAIHKMV